MDVNLFAELGRKKILLYQRIRRLSSEQKRIITKSKLSNPQIKLALVYKRYSKVSLRKALRWANRNHKAYTETIALSKYNTVVYYTPEHAFKEFIFLGFVPMSKFKLKKGYGYVKTNRTFKGESYIYPKNYGSDVGSKAVFIKWGHLI